MPASVGFCFCAGSFCFTILRERRPFRGLPLEQKQRAKMRRWLGAGCALALFCVCPSPHAAFAQEPATGSISATNPTSSPVSTSKSNPAGNKSSNSATKPRPATHPKSNTAAASHNGRSTHASSRKSSKRKTARGQQKIEPERAQAIQEALIREHYLSGEASGTWNQSSEEAMRRYQADHGWQSKTVPDSRALIGLGLGPSHDHLLNPESAMTTEPVAPHAATLTPVSHSADPGARTNPNPPVDPPPATTPGHAASDPQ